MNKRVNIWPEVIIGILLVFLLWGVWVHSSLPSFISNALYGTPSPAPTMASTPTPRAGVIFLAINKDEIAQLESFSNETITDEGIPAKMVIARSSTKTAPNGETVTAYGSEEFYVTLSAFLAENDDRMEKYDSANVAKVLISLSIDDLSRYSETIPEKIQIYLVPDPNCTESP